MTNKETISQLKRISLLILQKHWGGSVDHLVKFTFTLVLERVYKNLCSLEILIDDVSIHDHAIGLIGRNLLNDFITISFIIKNQNGRWNDVKEKLNSLHYTDVQKTKKSIIYFIRLE